eukprot:GHVT01002867.1.p1 GENE.GHVT01002867.1~~GHVT01002867.1.p1  ORF type:complete len:578 (-),score=159.14 GHVT01002867.1:831-2564(-)
MGGTKLKAGVRGTTAQYISRAQALKKLQIPLADFRRLCILKGVYPRVPPRGGVTRHRSTFYHAKDVLFLSHEPLLRRLRDLRAYQKRVRKALGRKDPQVAKKLVTNKPKYTLLQIVRERYPTLDDAVKDLDDVLCVLAIFAALSTKDVSGRGSFAAFSSTLPSTSTALQAATELLAQFHLFVAHTRAVRKAFISIKGFYIQAELNGITVTWLLPHNFTQTVPEEVDLNVLFTFLELYVTVTRCVNYKLFAQHQLQYPPPCSASMAKGNSLSFLGLVATAREEPPAVAEADQQRQEKGAEDQATPQENGPGNPTPQPSPADFSLPVQTIFEGLTFFLNRELPLQPFALLILSCGGRVGWQGGGSPFDESLAEITHHVVDRPLECVPAAAPESPARDFVQPQWIFDCLNASRRLPIGPYAPGKTLPAHLSPFVDEAHGGSAPSSRASMVRKLLDGNSPAGTEVPAGAAAAAAEDSDAEEMAAEEEATHFGVKAAAGAKGKTNAKIVSRGPYGLTKLQKEKRANAAEEELQRRMSLMPKKHKQLLKKIQYAQEQKMVAATRLKRRRRAVAKEGAAVGPSA